MRLLKISVCVFGILLCAGAVGFLSIWTPINEKAVRDATEIESKLVVHSSNPSEIVASDGTILYRIISKRRHVIDVMDLPAYVRNAMVAAEDRRFYDHQGVDFRGLFRSTFLAVREGHASQGASTLEMQLAKQLVNGDERSFNRKLKDIATAQQIEKLKSKTEILNLYMNQVYFGQGAYGIDAAAQVYFNKPASKLDISEAAMLARCVRHPARENPVKDLDGSIERRDYVLGVMRDEAWITEDEYAKATAEEPKLAKSAGQGIVYLNKSAGYFVQHVLKIFKEDFPTVDLQEGGYRIVTNLNYKLQRAANEAVVSTVRENSGRKVNDAAIVVVNSDGKIFAEVGGPSYDKSKFNTIVSGRLQPGSSFKPFVYAAALKEGAIHMGQELSNAPIYQTMYGEDWRPRNNGRERIGGTFSLEDAFALSVNLPAIHTIQEVGPKKVVGYAKDTFGFKGYLPPFESLAIGTCQVSPLEMARAYSVFMLRGTRIDPYPINQVIGPDGDVIKQYVPSKTQTGFDPTVCDEIDELMRGVVEHGTGTAAGIVPNARGKTGTTQEAKAAWFCGYADGVIGIGWAGHSVWKHGKPYSLAMDSNVYGGTVTAGMWGKVMLAAHNLGLTHSQAPDPERVASTSHPRRHEVDDSEDETIPNPRHSIDDELPKDQVVPDLPPDPPVDDPALDDSPPKKTKSKSKPDNKPDSDPAVPDSKSPDKPDADSTDDTPPPSHRVSKKSTSDESDTIEVDICADTGMRASRYCPETKTMRFRRGTEPRKVCTLHTGN